MPRLEDGGHKNGKYTFFNLTHKPINSLHSKVYSAQCAILSVQCCVHTAQCARLTCALPPPAFRTVEAGEELVGLLAIEPASRPAAGSKISMNKSSKIDRRRHHQHQHQHLPYTNR